MTLPNNLLDDLRVWLNEMPVAATVVAGLVVIVLAWYVGRAQKWRRTQAMLVAVNDATFGHCVPRSKTGTWGFVIGVEPAPEPFREFNISYQPLSIFDPVDIARMVFGRARASLQIAGTLKEVPTAEIIWVRGQPPVRALGVNPGSAPWIHTRLDFAGAEYATRGTNVGSLHHLFTEMYARFNPALLWVSVQRERRPQVRVMADGSIGLHEVSPLITSARALGRAALLE
jgi:hypothetical protein